MKKPLTNHLILLQTFFTYKVNDETSLKEHLNMKMKAVDFDYTGRTKCYNLVVFVAGVVYWI